jgi:hypothetical protein
MTRKRQAGRSLEVLDVTDFPRGKQKLPHEFWEDVAKRAREDKLTGHERALVRDLVAAYADLRAQKRQVYLDQLVKARDALADLPYRAKRGAITKAIMDAIGPHKEDEHAYKAIKQALYRLGQRATKRVTKK